MAMTAAGLKAKMIADLNSAGFDILNAATGGEGERYVEALAKSIVEYIQANGEAVDGGGTSPANWPIQ